MQHTLILVLLCLKYFHSVVSNENNTVVLKYGVLRGTQYKTVFGREVIAFFGIPFAAPPTGPNRFEPPKPVNPWTGEWNATQKRPVCTQYSHSTYSVQGEEDCLYLDLYTPRMPKNACPENGMEVIVFIQGGAFMHDDKKGNGPDYLLKNNDIVFVYINFRIGPLGFFTTGDTVVPGNNGLKDQVEALRWVQNNIRNFGGDPKRVTIAGPSSGGSSVLYHYLSPMSKGLFRYGISTSGVVLRPGAFRYNASQRCRQLAVYSGCPNQSSNDMVKCLKTKPANEIVGNVKKFLVWLYFPISTFGPTVETPNANSFLTEDPQELIRQGKIYQGPWLVSNVHDEGLQATAEICPNMTLIKHLYDNWYSLAPAVMSYGDSASSQVVNNVSEILFQRYFKNETAFVAPGCKTLTQVAGDRLHAAYTQFNVRELIAKNNNSIYYYKFNYRGKYGLINTYTNDTKDYGVGHEDDLQYILKLTGYYPLETAEDTKMIDVMVSIWISFVKSGKPQVSQRVWTSVSGDGNSATQDIVFLNINSPTNMTVARTNDMSVFNFWNSHLHEFLPPKE